jgi:hypothetical protein
MQINTISVHAVARGAPICRPQQFGPVLGCRLTALDAGQCHHD